MFYKKNTCPNVLTNCLQQNVIELTNNLLYCCNNLIKSYWFFDIYDSILYTNR